MSKKKDPLEGLSKDEIKFLGMLAKIFVESIVKQADQQYSLLQSSKRN